MKTSREAIVAEMFCDKQSADDHIWAPVFDGKCKKRFHFLEKANTSKIVPQAAIYIT